jgi:hypothetical protein
MLASRPRRTVTGALLVVPELLLLLLLAEPDAPEDDDELHPARTSAPATTAPTVTPNKGLRIGLFFYLVTR